MSLERYEIVRIDCVRCHTNGYVVENGVEEACPVCGGVGLRERRMPWKPEGYDDDEVKQLFGVTSFTRSIDKDDSAFDRK